MGVMVLAAAVRDGPFTTSTPEVHLTLISTMLPVRLLVKDTPRLRHTMGMTTTAPQRKHYQVRLSIRATGRTPADALQFALLQVLRDGLENANPTVEEVRDQSPPPANALSDLAPVGDPLGSGESDRAVRDGFHGLFLG
jgi:hypothetical protein